MHEKADLETTTEGTKKDRAAHQELMVAAAADALGVGLERPEQDPDDAEGSAGDDLLEHFLRAEHFVAVVLSRLRQDPMALDPSLWQLHVHTNRLWALKQQALIGSCEESRGSKEYHQVAVEDDLGLYHWRPCCFRMVGESKLKIWQELGTMSKRTAQSQYIEIVTEIAPDWKNPLSADSALLRTWTPDSESDRCGLCQEMFTFLNRRHHCRRCLTLVCAVCSPHSVPLRVFSKTAQKRSQRICLNCFGDMEEGASAESNSGPSKAGNDAAEAEETDTRRASLATTATSLGQDDPQRRLSSSGAVSARGSFVARNSLTSLTIHTGMLEFFHGSGFRKTWHEYFFVLLLRKGSLGMFLQAADHLEKKKRPAAVYKLSGYTLRVKSQKRRPHQFLLSHATKKGLHFAATSVEEMNLWIAQLMKAIEIANDLEFVAANATGATSSSSSNLSPSSTVRRRNSDLAAANDFTQDEA